MEGVKAVNLSQRKKDRRTQVDLKIDGVRDITVFASHTF